MSLDPPSQHRAYAPEAVQCAVLTVSDSRTADSDSAGDLIEDRLVAAGHKVVERSLLPDETDLVRAFCERAIDRADVDALIVTGGSGIAPRDTTPEAVAPLLEKPLPGFGELFRFLSFQEVGPAAMLSRAVAGTAARTVVFVLPGSRGAVQLALERLILPELGHLVGQLRR
ncbi:MAG: MogA/MoaB family molybdenum cofactor biosynthesis protein [Myxococcota bacterium]